MHELIKKYEVEDEAKVIEFLKKVTTLDQVNMDIVKHSVLAMRFEQVNGMVSYESFEQIGIIRYFIYDKTVTPEMIVNLFFELYTHALRDGVNQLVAVASNQYAKHLFEMLGFVERKQPLNLDIADLNPTDDVHVLSIQLEA